MFFLANMDFSYLFLIYSKTILSQNIKTAGCSSLTSSKMWMNAPIYGLFLSYLNSMETQD